MRRLDAAFNLTELANRYGSDKGTTFADAHFYTPLYDMILGPRRSEVSRMLEIGLLRNGPEVGEDADRVTGDLPSVRMWLDYFPHAMVHGFDISDFSFYQHDRFSFTRGDSGRTEDLEAIAPANVFFDFIIDDGSHASFHQQLAFATLFPKLRPGGIYIIEDLQWQSPFYEESLPATVKTVDLWATWLRTGAFPALQTPGLETLAALAADVSIAIIYNRPFINEDRSEAVVIHKKL